MRICNTDGFVNEDALIAIGLNHAVIEAAINQTYLLLDRIDETLAAAEVFPLSATIELANLSSMIGNIFASSIAKYSEGVLERNGPHKYPDLLSTGQDPKVPNLELKMALETNKPKGHLAKEGYYITCRYVLCSVEGVLSRGKENRGVVPYIWEVRLGYLLPEHFNISNTEGDSGKTAVVNAVGMEALQVIYCDLDRAPISKVGKIFKAFQMLFE